MNPNAFGLGLCLLFLAVNGFSFYLWCRLRTLVVKTSAEADALIGDNVAHLYSKYLFSQVMSGRFFSGSRMVVIGDPERDEVIRAVKGSPEYQRIRQMASYVRDVPINFLPYLL